MEHFGIGIGFVIRHSINNEKCAIGNLISVVLILFYLGIYVADSFRRYNILSSFLSLSFGNRHHNAKIKNRR